YPVSGTFVLNRLAVSGRIANGLFTERSVTADLQARNLRVGDYTANTLDAEASLRGDLIRIVNAQVVNQDTTLRGSGTIDLAPGGRINLLAESNQASLDIIRALPGQSAFPVRGAVDIAVFARGLTRQPTITASLEGRNLLVGTPPATPSPAASGVRALAATPGAPPSGGTAPTLDPAVPQSAFVISLLRAEGELTQDANNRARLIVPEILVRSGENELRGELDVPLRLGDPNGLVASDLPLTLRTTIGRLNLASLTKPLGISGLDAQGELTGSIALGGTLEKPILSGGIQLAGGKLRLPPAPVTDRDRVNPISSFDLDIQLAGQSINVRQIRLALGAPNGQKGSFGSVSTEGTISLTNLQDLGRLLGTTNASAGTPTATAPRRRPLALQGTTDLRVRFDSLQPVLENVTGLIGDTPNGLGESFRTRVDGALLVKGPLTSFSVSTAANSPIRLSDTYVQLPTRAALPAKASATPAINPRFSIAVDLTKGVTIASPGTFALQAEGEINVAGALYSPNSQSALSLQSQLTTTGGYFNYTVARFVVQKGGGLNVRFNQEQGLNVTVNDLTAKASIYNQKGTRPTLANRASDPSAVFGSTQPQTSTRSGGYRITATINGPLLLSDESVTNTNQAGPNLTFSSDPYLSTEEIIALIGTRDQFELAARGNISEAINLGARQALVSGYVPRLLAPLEGQVATAFGLEDFGVEYNPDSPLVLRLTKRLPDPFDRVLVDYSRIFQTRGGQNAGVQPYTFRVSYELGQLRATRGVSPRLQLGVQLNDQRVFTSFIQGTINY
ncbi:MAG: hypothetical protein H7Z41_02735, partial [Cytophagales bacterium]|nr:hypothetical protein [Armatimonadota bacterium]